MSVDQSLHSRFAAVVPDNLHVRRIVLFLIIAFGLNWLPAVYFALEGITTTTRNFSSAMYNAVIIVASFSPAVAHLLTRWVTDEPLSRDHLLLPLDLPASWRTYLSVAIIPLIVAVFGALVYFAVYPAHLAAQPLETLISRTPAPDGLGTTVTLSVFALATLLSLLPGAIMVFGEELGWRAYLLPKLVPLGRKPAALLTGIVWGVWHWPFIYLGVNYPNATWLGMLAMVWATTLYGTLLAWATFRTGSVWPAAVGHTAFNTSSRWGPMVANSTPNLALGPTTGGFIGALGWLIVAGWLLTRSEVFTRESSSDTSRQSISDKPAE